MTILFWLGFLLAAAVASVVMGRMAVMLFEPVDGRFGAVGSALQLLAMCAIAASVWIGVAAVAGLGIVYLPPALRLCAMLLVLGGIALQFGGFVGAWGFAMLLAAAVCAAGLFAFWIMGGRRKCAA